MPQLGERITYIGIDPGASGGLVAICGREIIATKMPPTEADLWEWVNFRSEPFGDRAFAVIEKVGGFIGGTGNPGSAMFKFGQSYGGLRMSLVAARIPFDEATPQAWQKALGVSPRKKGKGAESKTEWKNRLRAKAQQLFPRIGVTLATADALLIAEYCRRLRQGKI